MTTPKSSTRKLCLCRWMQMRAPADFAKPIRLHFFLFLYEMFCDFSEGNGTGEFKGLEAGQLGIRFSPVRKDMRIMSAAEFSGVIDAAWKNNPNLVDESLARRALFATQIRNQANLVQLTVYLFPLMFNVDRIPEDALMRVSRRNFSEHQESLVRMLYDDCTLEVVESHHILPIGGTRFVLTNKAYSELTKESLQSYTEYANDPRKDNPVYIEDD